MSRHPFVYPLIVNEVKVTQSCLTLQPHRLYIPWNSPGQNTGVSSLSLLQGIFPTQPGLLHCRQILYQLNHKGNPRILDWVAYPFSSGSSWLRNWTGISCITGGFFTNRAMREALSLYPCNKKLASISFLPFHFPMLSPVFPLFSSPSFFFSFF